MRRVCPACARKVPVTEAEAELLGPGIPFVARGTGCPQCNGTGYKGRVAIHEMVVINKALRRMIVEGASIEEMTDAARKNQGHAQPAGERRAAGARRRDHPRRTAEDHLF